MIPLNRAWLLTCKVWPFPVLTDLKFCGLEVLPIPRQPCKDSATSTSKRQVCQGIYRLMVSSGPFIISSRPSQNCKAAGDSNTTNNNRSRRLRMPNGSSAFVPCRFILANCPVVCHKLAVVAAVDTGGCFA